MKRLIFVMAVILLFTGCARSQSVEIQENIQVSQRLYRSFEEIVASHPIETTQELRPHHYESFSEVMYSTGGIWLRPPPTLEGRMPSPNIVRGRMGNDARIIYTEDGFPSVNMVSLEVLEVIKGELSVGETIRIVEQYLIRGGVLFSRDDYLPSIPYQEYIFFLETHRTEPTLCGSISAFWVIDGERARFPIPIGRGRAASLTYYLGEDGRFCASTQNFNSAIFGLGSHANIDIYMQLWEDVMNEFVLPSIPDMTGITLRPAEAVLQVGNTQEITAFVLPIGSAVTWASSNESVATVDANGVVTAVGIGAATITATTAEGEEATSEVLVISDNPNIGDVNGDGVVDFLDLLVLIYYLDNNGNISSDVTFVRENADLNGDGVICDLDLEILMTFLDVLGAE